ncbi:DUF4352 domain-containing protein [Paenibacillus sp. BR2-3]|uniref:DUF4352 domain-containing protein n=1 Tax=Paenibacillus sp. BR2-3 TaxID=3048494 RepID=UPI003977C7F0
MWNNTLIRRWCLAAFTILVVIYIAGCSNPSAKSTSNEQSGSETGQETPQTSGKEHKLGDTVVVDKLRYKVSSASTQKKIGNDSDNKTTDQQFIVLQVTIANTGTAAQLVDPSLFKLKDGQAREFEPMFDGDMYVNQGNIFFLQDVNPDSPREGNIVFEVPADATQLKLFVQSGIGFEGNHIGTIDLGTIAGK